MHKLRTSDKAAEELTSEEIAETLLKETGTADTFPTDEKTLLNYLNLEQLSFDFAQEFDFIPNVASVPKNLRAALSPGEKVVATHAALSPKRLRFSVLHEIGHFVLPEHRDRLFVDTDETLSWWTKVRLEREANQMAAELLFQGQRFTEEAVAMPLSCRTVHDLAPRYGASYESSMRRYVERHVLPCAVIVFDKVTQTSDESDPEDEQYKIQYTIASNPFRKQFFAGVENQEGFSRGSDMYKVHGARDVGNVVDTELTVERQSGEAWKFQTELFTNGYKIFQFVVRPLHKRR